MLALLCAYRLTPEQAPLLDLQLGQIRRLTTLPYTLYAADAGLPEELRARLDSEPTVTLVDCPSTAATGSVEHSHYLTHLTAAACAERASVVIILHPDSLPVRAGWDQAIVDVLSDAFPLVAGRRMNTSCFAFSREFYESEQPSFLLTDSALVTPLGQALLANRMMRYHSGDGFVFAVYRSGQSWFALDTARRSRFGFPDTELIGGLVFHLGSLARVVPQPSSPFARLALLARRAVPRSLRCRVLRLLQGPTTERLEASRTAELRREFDAALAAFLAEPLPVLAELEAEAQAMPLGSPRHLPQALSLR